MKDATKDFLVYMSAIATLWCLGNAGWLLFGDVHFVLKVVAGIVGVVGVLWAAYKLSIKANVGLAIISALVLYLVY